MSTNKIKKLFVDAVEDFLRIDSKLFESDTHEQAIAHRIAVYIEKDAPSGYAVDCEYNKMAGNVKRWGRKRIRPDIIVHKRGKNSRGDNLLVVEIKKEKVCKSNLKRLKFMTNPYNGAFGYELGCFLYFSNGKAQYIWVGGGRIQRDL